LLTLLCGVGTSNENPISNQTQQKIADFKRISQFTELKKTAEFQIEAPSSKQLAKLQFQEI
jgi:hypothetical protein